MQDKDIAERLDAIEEGLKVLASAFANMGAPYAEALIGGFQRCLGPAAEKQAFHKARLHGQMLMVLHALQKDVQKQDQGSNQPEKRMQEDRRDPVSSDP